MSKYKWGEAAQTPTVAFFHTKVNDLVQSRLRESGKSWDEAFDELVSSVTKEDFERIEGELLATGHRFDFSARISLDEAPEKYKPVEDGGRARHVEFDAEGRAVVGSGDNVFRTAEDVVGTARFINRLEQVMEMLADGVPPETVAVIDDSGGTFTAPILEEFTAVICKGGTIRSHLGILTREYRIPCLMAAELQGLSDGDRVRVEYTATPVSPYTDDASQVRARIWKLR